MTTVALCLPTKPLVASRPLTGFKVYAVDQPCLNKPHYGRRDYYKVILLTTTARLRYGHRTWDLDGTYLLFFNPHVPYALEQVGAYRYGYISLFTEAFFLAPLDRSVSLQQSPLLQIGQPPLCRLPAAQVPFVTSLFEKMLAEQQGDYPFRAELIRSYLQLLVHEALHGQPPASLAPPLDGATRLAARFLDALEQQFPLDSPAQTLPLKTAQDFADHLAVHVNHLNRAVKQATGKPTRTHLAARLTDEAQALLLHTSWSVAEIAASLGFAYPTYFNNFFKKHTRTTPLAWRKGAGRVAA